jgi:hypothetical protein
MRETQSAFIELHPSGAVIVRVREGISQTLEHARENVEVSIEVGGGKRQRPLLVNITRTAPLDPEARKYYAGGALAENFVALGMVVEASPLGRMMGNVFFRMMDAARLLNPSGGIPISLFADEESAIAWLTAKAAPGAKEP